MIDSMKVCRMSFSDSYLCGAMFLKTYLQLRIQHAEPGAPKFRYRQPQNLSYRLPRRSGQRSRKIFVFPHCIG
jgi:hypothetical protein